MTIEWSGDRRAAFLRLLGWSDTAVVQDAALLLVLERTPESMSIVCEALAEQEAAQDFEGQETILWVLSSAWKSGDVDVRDLLREVATGGGERARRGAAIAVDWLHVDA